MSTCAARQAKHSGRRGGGWTGIAAAVICGLLAAAGGAEELSEEEQLDLLEQAEDYVFDRDRDTDTAIALYMEVLEKVDLDPRIRLEIELQIGFLHHYHAPSDKWDLPTAVAWYEAVIDRYPITEPDVFDALGHRAQAFRQMDRYEEAKAAYLDMRQVYLSLPEEDQEKLANRWDRWNTRTLVHILSLHAKNGVEGVPGLRAMKAAYPGDEKLVREAGKAIDILEEAHEKLAHYEDGDAEDLPDLFQASTELRESRLAGRTAREWREEGEVAVSVALQLVSGEARRIKDVIDPTREELRELHRQGLM